jgi:predicted transposase YbfD/YdcC
MFLSKLISVLETMTDPRVARTRAHKLVDILVIALLAAINGAEGWEDMHEFADVRLAWLRGFLELPGGAPSPDTFRRVFEAIDARALDECLRMVTKDVLANRGAKLVAIDGKTVRRSFDRKRKLSPLHLVSAWASDCGITLGQIATDEKSNEITAIPELIKTIDVRGAIVTIDAMGCQKSIAEAIVESEGDYILTLKDNHPKLRAQIESRFNELTAKNTSDDVSDVAERGHGRQERRRVTVCNVKGLPEVAQWRGACSVIMVQRERTIDQRHSIERSFYLSSIVASAAEMGRLIRAHWSIENSLHWTLDVVFREDQSRIRSRTGATNLAAIRKLALSLLKLEQSRPGKSVAMKRKRAGWEPDYAFRILSAIEAN